MGIVSKLLIPGVIAVTAALLAYGGLMMVVTTVAGPGNAESLHHTVLNGISVAGPNIVDLAKTGWDATNGFSRVLPARAREPFGQPRSARS